MLLPLGSDLIGARRFAWLALLVAAVAAVASIAAPRLIGPTPAELAAQRRAIIAHWQAHPHLKIEAEFSHRFISRALTHETEERGRTRMASSLAPTTAEIREQQARLDRGTVSYWRIRAETPVERFALSPETGVAQIGWLTYSLLHRDLLHLLLSLIAFLALAPFAEALYGRLGGLLFWAASAAAGAAGYLLLCPTSIFPLLGLECVAAGSAAVLLLRFGWRRVEIYAWFVLGGRPFELPGWLWAALPGTCLLALYQLLGPATVAIPLAWATAAAAGGVLAILLRLSGLEARLSGHYVAPPTGVELPDAPGLAPYRDVLARHDDTYDALTEVARQALDDGNEVAAAAAIDRLLDELLSQDAQEGIVRVVKELAMRLPPDRFRPQVTVAIAGVLEQVDPWLADAAYQSLVDRGCVAFEPFLRAATLNLRRLHRPQVATAWCERILDADDAPADLRDRAGALLAEARAEAVAWAGVSRHNRPRTGPTPVGEIEHHLENPPARRAVPEVELADRPGVSLRTREEDETED